ncbi:MAG: hypothetical protein R2799_09415 [Crocinitomicaceae bacterium]
MKKTLRLLALSAGLTFAFASCDTTKCENSCTYAYDGVCDDGGSGSVYSVCDFGTDCSDCGAR